MFTGMKSTFGYEFGNEWAKEADIQRTYRIATITQPLPTSLRPNVYAVESHFRYVEDVR